MPGIGILVGMWPCGVIALLRELFLAESKAQVYGHLHEFLKSAPAAAANLSMYSSISSVWYAVLLQIFHAVQAYNIQDLWCY